MKKKARVSIVIGVMLLLIVAITVVASLALQKTPSEKDNFSETKIYDTYKFEREIEVDGKKLEFYQSGDQRFKYDHDKDGYVLIPNKDNTNLEYLTKVDGKIIGSGVTLDKDASGIEKVKVEDLDRNDPRFKLEPIEIKSKNRMSDGKGAKVVKNLVVYVQFKGEPGEIPYTPNWDLNFTDIDNYYKAVSQNKLSLDSVPAMADEGVYIYTAPNTRSYYNVKDSSSNERRNKEYELVSGLFNEIKDKYDLTADELDKLGPQGTPDGYVDSVAIFITGSRDPAWGGLLWPHKWNIRDIKGESSTDPKIKDKWFGDYTINFINNIDIGVVCHEMGHVFGAPDYYHYNDAFVPVGEWDLMSYQKNEPQYMLVHTRDKYLKSVEANQIQTITSSGTYTAYAATLSRTSGIGFGQPLAYKIPTDKPDEHIMIEMRSTASSYDSLLKGTGLIVYRIKDGIDDGNADAIYRRTDKPDELFVYRPQVYHKPNTSLRNSFNDANLGYLSIYNNNFNHLGKPLDPNNKKTYEPDAIYYLDGRNTGIQITPLSTNSDYSQFTVILPGDESTPENIFDKFEMLDAFLFQDELGAGVEFKFLAESGLNLNALKNIQANLLRDGEDENEKISCSIANIEIDKFKNMYRNNTSVFTGRFYLGQTVDPSNIFKHTKVMTGDAVLEEEYPNEVSLVIFDINNNFSEELKIPINKMGKYWTTLSKLYPEASIYASDSMSVALDKNGIARTNIQNGNADFIEGDTFESKWNIEGRGPYISIALSRDHVLALKKDLSVEAYGFNYYGEIGAKNWDNIIAIAAGYGTSYGLTPNGTVLMLGDNSYGQGDVRNWSNIIDIQANYSNVAGITADGKVKIAGQIASSLKQIVEAESNVSSVSLSNDYIVLVYKNGKVKAFGDSLLEGLNSSLDTLSEIKKASAALSYFSLLTKDGKVITPIGPSEDFYKQFENLIDIVDLSCGTHHAMFLREDGMVEYVGQNEAYQTNVHFDNLIFTEGEFKKVKNIEIKDSFGFSMPTTMQLDYDENEPRYVYLTMKTIADNDELSTYKRLIWSFSSIEGESEVGEIEIDIEKHPKTGNDVLKPGEDVTIWRITSIKEGFLRLNIRAHGTNISKTIDIEVRKYIPLEGILIEGTKLDADGNPDLTKPSIYIKEYTADATTLPPYVQLKVLKNPINALGSISLPKPTYTVEPTGLITIDDEGRVRAIKGANLEANDECKITATLEYKNVTYETFTIVKIISEIDEISVIYPDGKTSLDLKYGDAFPYSEIQIKVKKNLEDGETEIITMGVSANMINATTYNSKTLGEQEVELKYLNKTAIVSVFVSDYIKDLFVENPKTKYKYLTISINPQDEIGEIKYVKASDGTEETCTFSDKPFTGTFSTNLKETSIYKTLGEKTIEIVYSKHIGSYLNKVRTTYQIQVVDYVESLGFINGSTIASNTLVLEYQKEIKDYGEYLVATFKSGKKVNIDFYREQVSIYGYVSNILGTHKVSFSYRDEFENEVFTSSHDVTVALGDSAVDISGYEIYIDENNKVNKYFYYLEGGDLILGSVEITSSSLQNFEIEKYNGIEGDQDIYYNFETNNTGEEPDKFNKNIVGRENLVPIGIYMKQKDSEGVISVEKQLTEYISVFGIIRWEIKGLKGEDGSFISNGTVDAPLEFTYGEYDTSPNQSLIALYYDYSNKDKISATIIPSKINFDNETVDETQELQIDFIGGSTPKIKVGADYVDQKYYIKIKDKIEDILFDEEIEIPYGNAGKNLRDTFAKKLQLQKRFRGIVYLKESEYKYVSYEDPQNYEDISKVITDNGIKQAQESHHLVLKYSDLDFGINFEKSFTLKVYDEVKAVTVENSKIEMGYQDEYMNYIGHTLFEFTLTYAKNDDGTSVVESYILSDLIDYGVIEKDEGNFSNAIKDVYQIIKITHIRSSQTIDFNILVRDYVSKIEFAFLEIEEIFQFMERPAIFYKDILENDAERFVKVRKFMKSGEENDILDERFIIEGTRVQRYDETSELVDIPSKERTTFSTENPIEGKYLIPGKWKIKTIYVPAEGEYVRSTADITSIESELLVQNYVAEMSVSLKQNARYPYGKNIDFSEVTLKSKMEYDEGLGTISLSGKEAITKSFEFSYDSTKGGLTTVTFMPKPAFRKNDIKATQNFNFADKKELQIRDNNVFYKSSRSKEALKILGFEILVFEKPANIIQIWECFTNLTTDFSFLLDYIYLNDTKISLTHNESVKSGDILELRNADNNAVFKYALALVGDATQDGLVNEDDITILAHMLLRKRSNPLIYIPEVMGGSKAKSEPLTSFVLRIREITNSSPQNVPLPINDMANTFISPKVKLKNEKEENIVTIG